MELTYKVEAYEGPLDVLLSLIRKNEINIYDIPIAELLEQFMEHIVDMRAENLEVASEFFIMAANLVQIKSFMLLPRYDEEAEDPRTELVNMLLEYDRYKHAAEEMRAYESGALRMVREPLELPVDMTYTRTHDVYELINAYTAFSASTEEKRSRKADAGIISRTVLRKAASVSSRILMIMRMLAKKTRITFLSLVGGENIRGEAVAAFSATLELARAGRIAIDGDGLDMSIRMTKSARMKLKHKLG